MIATLEGILTEAQPLSIVLETGGIGYQVAVPLTTAERLPALKQKVKLFIQAVYREDTQALYGFHCREDRDFFRLLVEKVSGVGPKLALSIMSRLSVSVLKNAIAQSDVTLLSQCPGIGKKTAERLIVELRDKLFPGSSAKAALSDSDTVTIQTSALEDAVSGLITLGYKAPEADKVIRRGLSQLGPEASAEALIKHALS